MNFRLPKNGVGDLGSKWPSPTQGGWRLLGTPHTQSLAQSAPMAGLLWRRREPEELAVMLSTEIVGLQFGQIWWQWDLVGQKASGAYMLTLPMTSFPWRHCGVPSLPGLRVSFYTARRQPISSFLRLLTDTVPSLYLPWPPPYPPLRLGDPGSLWKGIPQERSRGGSREAHISLPSFPDFAALWSVPVSPVLSQSVGILAVSLSSSYILSFSGPQFSLL